MIDRVGRVNVKRGLLLALNWFVFMPLAAAAEAVFTQKVSFWQGLRQFFIPVRPGLYALYLVSVVVMGVIGSWPVKGRSSPKRGSSPS